MILITLRKMPLILPALCLALVALLRECLAAHSCRDFRRAVEWNHVTEKIPADDPDYLSRMFGATAPLLRHLRPRMNALPVALWIVPMIVTVIVARQKGYRLLIWIPLAVVFSVFALCLIALLPPQRELKERVSRAARAWREDGKSPDLLE